MNEQVISEIPESLKNPDLVKSNHFKGYLTLCCPYCEKESFLPKNIFDNFHSPYGKDWLLVHCNHCERESLYDAYISFKHVPVPPSFYEFISKTLHKWPSQ